MFATIRRHQTWLWVLIMGVTIITFVIFFTPGATRIGSGPSADLGTIYGRPINLDRWRAARRDVELRYFIHSGNWLGRDAFGREAASRVDTDVRYRLVLLDQANALRIQADDDVVARWISLLPTFEDPRTKTFSPDAYDRFVSRVLPASPNIRLDEHDFTQFARHQIALSQLQSLIGLSGELITPREAQAEYRQRHEDAVTEIAWVSLTNYLAAVRPTPAALARFYTNRLAVYRLPKRVQVSYVKFSSSNYLAQAKAQLAKQTNLAERIDAVYQEQGPDYYTDAQGHTLSAAAAKAQIRKRILDNLALRAAVTNAADFARQLYALKPFKASNLNRLAAAKGMVVHRTEPFNQTDGPKGIDQDAFTQAAFQLTAEEPFSSTKSEDGFYLMALDRRLPSEIPPLSTIRQQVETDYRRQQALQMAQAAGRKLYLAVTNGLAHGKSFRGLCLTNRVPWLKPPPFSLSTDTLPEVDQNGLDLSQIKEAAFALAPHQLSQFTSTRRGGFLVYLDAYRPADPAKMKADLPAFLASLRRTLSLRAYEEWFGQQFLAAHVTKPAPNNP